MKVLSIQQPWASLIMAGVKHAETRSWSTLHRGELGIHSSASIAGYMRNIYEEDSLFCALLKDIGVLKWPDIFKLPLGKLLGTVNLINCVSTTSGDHYWSTVERALGDFSRGRFAWLFDKERTVYAQPIPLRGSLSLWTYNPPTSATNEVDLTCRN